LALTVIINRIVVFPLYKQVERGIAKSTSGFR